MAGEHTEVIEARDEGETEHHFPAAEWEAAIERDTLIVRKRDGETVGDGNAESDNLAMAVDRRAHDSGPPRTLAQLGQYMRTFYNRKAR
jgi:hypothetical protein